MYSEANMRTGLRELMATVAIPEANLAEIRRRAAAATAQRAPGASLRFVASAAAAITAVLLINSPTFVRAVEDRYAAALRALGISPPPAAPYTLRQRLLSQEVTLTVAQGKAPFHITQPAGLPSDVVSNKISVTPTGLYDVATRAWRVGGNSVTFFYHRRHGAWFRLTAERFDPHSAPPVHYIYEPIDLPGGRVRLLKHEHFAWRNGDQVMMAVAGSELSVKEIMTIARAMNGQMLPRISNTAPRGGSSVKLYVIPKP